MVWGIFCRSHRLRSIFYKIGKLHFVYGISWVNFIKHCQLDDYWPAAHSWIVYCNFKIFFQPSLSFSLSHLFQPCLLVCLGHYIKDFHKNVRFSPFSDVIPLFSLILCNCYSSLLRKFLWNDPQWRRGSYARVSSDILYYMVEWISDVFSVFHSFAVLEVQLTCQHWLVSDSGHWGCAWAVR